MRLGNPYCLLLALLCAACDPQSADIAVAPVVQISNSSRGAFEVSVAVVEPGTRDEVAVAWYDTRDGNGEIYMRLLDTDLQPLGDELRITNSSADSYEADLVARGNELFLAWYEVDDRQRYSLSLRSVTPAGETLWQRQMRSPYSNLRIPLLRATDEQLFLAWVEDPVDTDTKNSQIVAAWYDLRGRVIHDRFPVGPASADTWNLNGEIDDNGQVLLTYDASFETQASELYLAQIDGNQVSRTRVTDDDGFNSKYPDIAIEGNKLAITWFDNRVGNNEVYLALVGQDTAASAFTTGAPLELEQDTTRVTTTQGDSVGAYLAWNEGTLGLTWNDNETGNHEIYWQIFDQTGRPLSAQERLTEDAPDSLIPAIEALGVGFVLSWNSAVLGDHEASEDTTTSQVLATRMRR